MSKFSFIATGDTHFGLSTFGVDQPDGLNSRALDGFSGFDQLIDYAINNDIKLITHSGDVFNHKSVSQVIVNEFFKRVKRIVEAGIDFVVLSGNHDKSILPQAKCSLDLLKTLNIDVYVTDGSELIDLGYVQVATLGYYLTNDEIEEQLTQFNNQMDWARPAILLGHLQVETPQFENASFKEDLHLTPLGLLTRYPYQFISLGHLHKPLTLCEAPKTMYNGSLVRCSFAEEKDRKGFNIVTLDGPKFVDVTRQPVKCLRMLTLKGNMTYLRESLTNVDPDNFEGSIIRCVIDETEEIIDEKFLKTVFAKAFKVVIQKEKKANELVRMDRGGNLTNMQDALNVYFAEDIEKYDLLNLVKELQSELENKVER